ncbi:transcriptional antiterminator RfaH [Ferrimonas sediminum]|uniref:Transcriptional antiterminator RfaH n=1 Tax=Ferrimonas sediminum TaxID=718193 RepID=A0A1G8YYZ1_9GAMM|nr:transcription termination/antitermination NusG family protein [Ferrimonas sediminum]SDK08048.1 transcriptional antiterminator RfaH [Ferrimonas sediminum]
MLGWYLFRSKPRAELQLQQQLECRGYQVFVPVFTPACKPGQVVAKPTPLFPGYLFVRFDPYQESVGNILSLSAASQIIKTCGEVMPVELSLVRALRKRCARTEPEVSELNQPQFSTGMRVQIKEGPFARVEAIFHETVGRKRCKLLLELLGQVQMVEANLNDLAIGDRFA